MRQRADRYNKIGPPKSESGGRTIPLPADLVLALKKWKLECLKRGNPGLVFATTSGAIQRHGNMLRLLEVVQRAAGVVRKDADGKNTNKAKYALHAFRHFFASWCINPKERGGRDLSPKVAQTLLGHSSIQMTYEVYGHLFPAGDDRAELDAAARDLVGASVAVGPRA